MKKSTLLASVLSLGFGLLTLGTSAQICFSPEQKYAAGSGSWSIVKADFNGDGKLDLATANGDGGDVSILLGIGNGTFGTPSSVGLAAGSWPAVIISADFNADGKADLATANYNGNSISIMLGNGTGGFAAALNIPVNAINPSGLTSGDFNADGKVDLAVVYDNGSDVSILIGNGTGGFAAPVNYNAGYWYNYSVISSDLNGDGKLDLAIAHNDDGRVSIMIGNGNGTFQAAVPYITGGCPSYITVADMNSDAKMDLVVSSTCGTLYFVPGNGNGTFQSPVSLSFNDSYGNVVADL